ncbi:MAG: hypothetical protein RRZ38_01810, partial [Hafnia sp.]
KVDRMRNNHRPEEKNQQNINVTKKGLRQNISSTRRYSTDISIGKTHDIPPYCSCRREGCGKILIENNDLYYK